MHSSPRASRRRSSRPVDVIALHAAGAGAASIRGRFGLLPLHVALRVGASEETIQELLSVNSSAAAIQDDQGNLPLHLIPFEQTEANIVAAVIRANPRGPATFNNRRCLPLHIAIKRIAIPSKMQGAEGGEREFDVSAFAVLLAAHEDAAKVTFGERTPLQWMMEDEIRPEIVSLLVYAGQGHALFYVYGRRPRL